MSNLTLNPQWHDSFNQLETDEFILGGADGNINLAPKQLAESLLYLKQQMSKIPIEPIQVGDIYTTTINHTSAAAVKAHHGYGTWKRYAEGRTLVGHSTKSSDPAEYKTMGKMFGENEHTLTIKEMPSHKHEVQSSLDVGGDFGFAIGRNLSGRTFSEHMAESGNDQPHNNIQPSIVVQYWVRTA